jgi:hypothetical protein
MPLISTHNKAHMVVRLMPAMTLASFLLSGCACVEDEWDALFISDAEARGFSDGKSCDSRALLKRSKTFAEFAARADPHELEIARLEAERDCYRAAATRARRQATLIKS